MTRRVLIPRPLAVAKARQRMAPGGRVWSESPIRPFGRLVGEAGSASTAADPEAVEESESDGDAG